MKNILKAFFILFFTASYAYAVQKPGVVATYFYENMNLSGGYLSQAEGTTSATAIINNNWVNTAPPAIAAYNNGDRYSIRYTGYLKIPVSGRYTFSLTSDDGSRLYLNCNATGKTSMATATDPMGTLLINSWVDQSATTTTASCSNTFTAGEYYKFVVEYYENGGQSSVQLQWSARHGVNGSTVLALQNIPSGNIAGTNGGSYYDDVVLNVNVLSAQTSCAVPRQAYILFDGAVGSASATTTSNYTLSNGALVNKVYLSPDSKMAILLLNTDLPSGTPVDITVANLLDSSGVAIATKTVSATYAGGQVLQSGIKGTYYNQNNTQRAYFTGSSTARIDSNINFNWGTGSPGITGIGSNYFTVAWTGYIKFPSSKSYILRSTTDDGGRLYIDPSFTVNTSNGAMAISKWVDQSATATDSGTFSNYDSNVYLPIRHEFYEQGGDASASLAWRTTDGTLSNTVIPASGFYYCATPIANPSAFNAVEPTENYYSGHIFGKLAGTPFTLKIAALKDTNSDGVADAIESNFAADGDRSVTVDVIDMSGSSMACSARPYINRQTITYRQSDQPTELGIKNVTFTVNDAYTKLGVRVIDSGYGLTACSTDMFSVRPLSFSVTSTASNGLTTGTPIVKAGDDFTLYADSSYSNYTGTPSVDASKIQGHVGAIRTGSIAGSFSAVTSGKASGTFTYDEVGNFLIKSDGVIDSAWTLVDSANSDCTLDSSNTLNNGKYGCYVSNTADTSLFGRFTPSYFSIDNISLKLRADYPTCSGTFNYIGEDINWAFDLTARAKNGSITKNYTGSSYVKVDLTNPGNYTLRAKNGTTVQTTSLGSTTGTFSAGVASASLNGSLGRSTPVDMFSADWGVSIVDSDNIRSVSNIDLDNVAGNESTLLTSGIEHRFGIMSLSSVTGNSNVAINVPVQVHYRKNGGWLSNNADSCTQLSAGNVFVGNFSGLSNADVNISGTSGVLSGGKGYITVKSGAGKKGTFNLGVQNNSSVSACGTFTQGNTSTSASRSYLQTNACGALYDKDHMSKVTIGVPGSSGPVIYWREKH